MEAISAESALLWKEQQALLKEMARAKHAASLATMRLMLHEHNAVGGGTGYGHHVEAIEELRSEISEEERNYARLKEELVENRKALQGLQEEIPERIVSSQRLSQMRLVMKHQQAATDSLRFKQQARSKVNLMQELVAAWHHVIPPAVRKVLLASFDLTGREVGDKSRRLSHEGAATMRFGSPGEDPPSMGMPPTLPVMVGGSESHRMMAAPSAAAAVAPAPALSSRSGINSHRPPLEIEVEADPRRRTPDKDNDEIYADGGHRSQDEEEEGADMEPELLDGSGAATPWRTLGALAMRAGFDKNNDADGAPASNDGEAANGDGGGMPSERSRAKPSALVRKASADLAEARTKRLSVLKFVEEATSPDPNRAAAARRQLRNRWAAPEGEEAEETEQPQKPPGSRLATNVRTAPAPVEPPASTAIDISDNGETTSAGRVKGSPRKADGGAGGKFERGHSFEVVNANEDDPLMMSYYPAVPAWLSSLPSPAVADPNASKRPPGGFNPNLLEALKLGSQMAAEAERSGNKPVAPLSVDVGGYQQQARGQSAPSSHVASPRGGAPPSSSGLNGRPLGGYASALGGNAGMEVVGRGALGRASAPFRTDQQPLSDRGTASSGTPTGRGPRLAGTPFGGGAAETRASSARSARPSTAGGTPSGLRPPSTGRLSIGGAGEQRPLGDAAPRTRPTTSGGVRQRM